MAVLWAQVEVHKAYAEVHEAYVEPYKAYVEVHKRSGTPCRGTQDARNLPHPRFLKTGQVVNTI